jgi:hypothetical protein
MDVAEGRVSWTPEPWVRGRVQQRIEERAELRYEKSLIVQHASGVIHDDEQI